jgi:hypothetical protein
MKRSRRYPVWPQFLGVIGIFGFLGLLIASAYLPHWALALRIAAVVWFLGIGAAKIVLELRAEDRFRSRFSQSRHPHSRSSLR